jgi:uncharacterized protein (TIGR03382 family)
MTKVASIACSSIFLAVGALNIFLGASALLRNDDYVLRLVTGAVCVLVAATLWLGRRRV